MSVLSVPPLRTIALISAAALGLGACSSYDRGFGYASVGYASAGYCDPYYDDCHGGGYYDRGYYGRDRYPSYYGWYGDHYYPGVGIHVFDRYGRRHRWNDYHRRHWEGRRYSYRNSRDYREDRREIRENWSDFRRERAQDRRDYRRGDVSRGDYRRDRRDDRRDLRRENRRDRRD